MSARPRLLFLCHTYPYPPDGGPWIRTYHVLRLLARAFDITALCFERSGARSRQGANSDSRTPLRRLAAVERFAIPQRRSRLRFWWDHLRSVTRGRVYTTYLYESSAFERRLAELVASGRFDLVHADSLDLARYLPLCGGLPIVGVHHDIESVLLARKARVDRHPLRRAYLRYQSGLMEQLERRWCGQLALNVVCSHRDASRLRQRVPDARIAVVPNGVDVDAVSPCPDGSGVAFAGGTSPFPNGDALNYFCEQILPHLRAGARDVPVRWIGRAAVAEQRRYRDLYGVELTGYVADASALMANAACHIVPLRVGGGTRLKILDGWALGKAVVSTSIGCEGLDAEDGSNILVRDDPAEFAAAVRAVLDDADLRRRLGAAGRRTAEAVYGWNVIGRPMLDTYRSLIGRATARHDHEHGRISERELAHG